MPILVRQGLSYETVSPSQFSNEEELELILQNCPQLLCDDDPSQGIIPSSVVFVERQIALPEAGKLDLLFIARDGIPIAVEVKLARNAQARREVVAQAIDYVSSLTALTVDELDDLVERRLDEALRTITADNEADFDRLWRTVGTNLRAGKARLLIAVDDSTPSLERILHFLARSSSLDVQLVSIQRYSSSIGEVIVSRRRVNPAFEHQSGNDTPRLEHTIRTDDDQTITLLVTENPKREGSASRERFRLYRTGMTVKEYLQAGGSRADLRWDSQHNFIRLDAPVSGQAAAGN